MGKKLFFIILIIFIQFLGQIGCSTTEEDNPEFDPSKIKPWPGGKIYYCLNGNFTESQKDILDNAINEWEDGMPIEFKNTKCGKNVYRITLVNYNESVSTVGYINGGNNEMIIGRDNYSLYNISHELGHALGLLHEFNRPDRDSFITIYWDNILPEKKLQYNIYDNPLYEEESLEYDYNSIMEYYTYWNTYDFKISHASLNGTDILPDIWATEIDREKIRTIYDDDDDDDDDDDKSKTLI